MPTYKKLALYCLKTCKISGISFYNFKMFRILNLLFRAFIIKFNTKQNPFTWKKLFAVLSNNWENTALFQELISIPL